MRTASRWFTLLWVLALLAACAASPDDPAAKQRSDALLEAQLAQARQALAPGQPPRVVFAGFALHSESKAFRGDVELGARVMRAVDPQAVVLALANPALGQDSDWPFATRENVAAVMQAIAAHARPGDRVVLLFASHGAPQMLGVRAANRDLGQVTAADVQQWLVPLGAKPTLVIVSACHSGSFIPALRARWRIVLTASAAGRSSFGCQFHSRNTFFLEELLARDAITASSLQQLMDDARAGVQRREQALRLEASDPRMFVGEAAQGWAQQPLSDWMRRITP